MKHYRYLAALAIAIQFVAHATTAEEPPQYQVEVVIFEHADPAIAGETFVAEFVDTELQGKRRIGRFGRLAAEDYQLGDVVARLSRASSFKPVIHTGWVHPGVEGDDARAKAVSGRTTSGASISGSVTLFRDRRLHLELDLEISGAQAPFKLEQRRRIRSRTLQYFDHPRFGVIALVTPL